MSTPSANATTAPRSPGFMVFRNPAAASCTTSILSDMLELVSIKTMRSRRRFGGLEELHVLRHAVLEDREVGGRKSFHELFGRVGDRDVQRHEVGAAAEHRHLGGRVAGGPWRLRLIALNWLLRRSGGGCLLRRHHRERRDHQERKNCDVFHDRLLGWPALQVAFRHGVGEKPPVVKVASVRDATILPTPAPRGDHSSR